MGSTTRTVKTKEILYILSQTEREEEGQYTRLMPTLELDDPMAYRNFLPDDTRAFSRAGVETRP